jgi:hypothetical protein
MGAVTPRHPTTADQHSHIVRPAEMEWQKTLQRILASLEALGEGAGAVLA